MADPIQINETTKLAIQMILSFAGERADHFICAAIDASVRVLKSHHQGMTNLQALELLRITIGKIADAEAEVANGRG